jgi:ATP-dependent Clp protease ATP-binding subunit ClpC
MFDRFGAPARDVMRASREEAGRLGHDFIAPAHVLIALLADAKGVPAKALENLHLDPAAVAARIRERVPHGPPGDGTRPLPFTPGAKRLLEAALEEAQRFGHDRIGTEHLFLGALRADDADFLGDHVARAFDQEGVKTFEARAETIRLLEAR